MIRIDINGTRGEFPENTTAGEAVNALLPESEARQVLCCMCCGESWELMRPLTGDCTLVPLTYRDDEGRRTYERSLRFLLILAVKRLWPGKKVRILHSVGHGIYFRFLGTDMSHETVKRLNTEMRLIIKEDLPFETVVMSSEQADEYFRSQGWKDKTALSRYRSSGEMHMYRIGPLTEDFYGSMVPRTGMLNVFELRAHFPGAFLMLPDPADPGRPAAYESCSGFLRQFHSSEEWCSILGAENAADVNDMLLNGDFRDFIRVNEMLQERMIFFAGDEICRRRARIVMIFGPSSSGKTTSANRLGVYLRTLGKKTHLLSLDDFYRNRSDLPVEEDGQPDLESIDALDIPHLITCLESLMSGAETAMPRFDFTTQCRSPETVPLQLGNDDILLIEGIHGLNRQIAGQMPEQLTYGIYVSALGCINLDNHNRIRTTDVRLLRRIVRDMRTRGTSPRETIAMWPKVRAGEEKWIFPNQEKADLMINTSLHYELPVLRRYAWDVLNEIRPDEPEYLAARRLIKILQFVLPLPDNLMDEIPPMSILREFIGDSSFYDKH